MGLLFYIITSILSLLVMYYIIKQAVKHALLEVEEMKSRTGKPQPERYQGSKYLTPKQKQLQADFEAGKLPFDEYLKEWNTP